MKNVLYFSDYIKPIAKKIKFAAIVIGRFFKILFRRRKGIKLLQLDYAKNYQFNNSYMIIRYRFRNALWYNFKNIKKTTEKEIIVLNLKNLSEKPIQLVVHGIFRKMTILISVVAENTIESKLFKIKIQGLNDLKSLAKSFELNNPSTVVTIPKINLSYPNIQIKHSSFSQNDFI